jgi:hypothetical protein
MTHIPPYNYFAGTDRVSVYEDGTLEIQNGDAVYRAPIASWVRLAAVWGAPAHD